MEIWEKCVKIVVIVGFASAKRGKFARPLVIACGCKARINA